MKLTETKDHLLLVMIAAAGIALGIVFGSSDAEGGPSQAKVVAPSAFVYFPAQYTLDAPNQISEHVQAF